MLDGADGAGLVRIALPRPSVAARGRRLVRTTASVGRYLAPALARRVAKRPDSEFPVARALRRACEDLGATYVKFGQFVGSAPDIVGEGTANEFRSCLDTGPHIASGIVRGVIERELGRPLHELFSRFDGRPIAAASVAVVHRAWLPDGTPVAVKVLRPGTDAVVASDLALMQPFFGFLARQGFDQADALNDYLIGLKQQVCEELDLRNEARAMDEFREMFSDLGLSLLVVPRVYPALSARRVLTMEYLDGVAIDDLPRIAEYGIDPRPHVRELLQAWVLTALRYSAFHADIHAGNLLLLRDGRLGMLDWGIVARLDPETQLLVRRLVEAAMGRDAAWDEITQHFIKIQGVSLKEGFGLTDEQIGRIVRGMMEPVLTQPVGDISMSSLFSSSDDAIKLATGEDTPKRSLRQRFAMLQRARKAYRLKAQHGLAETSFSQATFLSAKQLVYLERYWKMYLPDEPLLGDRPFLTAALAYSGDGVEAI